MKTITDILKAKDAPLAKLLQHLQTTQNLNAVLHMALDPDLAKHCHVSHYKQDVLTLTVPNSAWATRLRYAIPEIIKNLQIHPEFKKLTKIRYIIISNNKLFAKPKPLQTKLSQRNEKLWRKTLNKLSQRTKNHTHVML